MWNRIQPQIQRRQATYPTGNQGGGTISNNIKHNEYFFFNKDISDADIKSLKKAARQGINPELSRRVKLIIKDAGKTLIQVIDNGKGMSVTDARLSFERHATSKIKNAEDLLSDSILKSYPNPESLNITFPIPISNCSFPA